MFPTCVKDLSSSICEQVFSWFRGYASTLNTTSGEGRRFLVLVYAKRHNACVLSDTATYINPHSARRKTMKKVGTWKRPSSHAYACKKLASSPKLLRRVSKEAGGCQLRPLSRPSILQDAHIQNPSCNSSLPCPLVADLSCPVSA